MMQYYPAFKKPRGFHFPAKAMKMQERILLVGYDDTLLATRLALLNLRWSARAAYPKDALNLLETKGFDLLILCHSLEENEAVSLVNIIRERLPLLPILALERLEGTAVYLGASATVVTTEEPILMFDAIQTLLESTEPRVA